MAQIEKKKICSIDLTNSALDNEYTFYEDGTIHHYYDQNAFKLNQEQWLTVDDIDVHLRSKLLEKCEPKFRIAIEYLFNNKTKTYGCN